MSQRSGSVKPLMISRAFTWRSNVLLSSGFQVCTQRVSIARSGQRARAWTVSSRDSTLDALFLSRVCSRLSHLLLTSPDHFRHSFLLVPQAMQHRQQSHHPLFLNQSARDSMLRLRLEQLWRLVKQVHRFCFSCHHDLFLPPVVLYQGLR